MVTPSPWPWKAWAEQWLASGLGGPVAWGLPLVVMGTVQSMPTC